VPDQVGSNPRWRLAAFSEKNTHVLVPFFPVDSADRAGVFVLLVILVILSLYVYSY